MRVVLGEQRVWKGHGRKRRCITKEDEVVYIPVLDTLTTLLSSDTVFSEVNRVLQ